MSERRPRPSMVLRDALVRLLRSKEFARGYFESKDGWSLCATGAVLTVGRYQYNWQERRAAMSYLHDAVAPGRITAIGRSFATDLSDSAWHDSIDSVTEWFDSLDSVTWRERAEDAFKCAIIRAESKGQ